MKKYGCLILLPFLLANGVGPKAIRPGKDYAVFFYVTQFQPGWQGLPDTQTEAQTLKVELESNYGFIGKLVPNPTRQQILDEIAAWNTRLGPDDQVLFFFSMHGYYDPGSELGYLVAADGKYNDPYYTSWLDYNSLRPYFARCKAKHVLVALDACHSGSFGNIEKAPDHPAYEEGDDCEAKLQTSFRYKVRQYLCAGNKDAKTPGKSQLVAKFLEALRKGADADGLLHFDDLTYALGKLRNPEPVHGTFSGHEPGGDFVFVRKNGCGAKVETADRDGDGIPNADDRCPDAYGTATNHGCPETNAREGSADADLDGIPDPTDACPNEYGTAKAKGCPDADDDGVPDRSDKCRYAPGEARWEGCPDSDGDGLPDHLDRCPDQKGPAADSGCPPSDRDRDGVPDRSDKCPDAAGKANFSGCPDTDGDGIPDPDDKCPTEKGEASRNGCPRPDNMALVRGGTFQMGSEDGEDDEKPVHAVTVSDFYLSKYEVTVAEFRAFVEATSHQTDAEKEGTSRAVEDGKWVDKAGRNWHHDPEGKPAQDKHPVINVSWNDATAYCQWLSQKTGLTYRLPTEAEWEYAAGNGARHTKYSWGNGDPSGKNGGNVTDESKRPSDGAGWGTKFIGFNDGYWFTAPVGSYNPNDFGLFDMTGNVSEWCSDWKGTYASTAQTNPTGSSSGSSRVIRGGSWDYVPQYCRVADRDSGSPGDRYYNLGFRLARTK